jgi:hypothetical protein
MTQKINKLYLGKHRDDIVMTEYNELWDKADFCNRYYYNSYGLLYYIVMHINTNALL